MSEIKVVEREMTDAEFARMKAGFDEHTLEHGNPLQTYDRYGFVLMDDAVFLGCSSGIVYKNGAVCNGWFCLTDLFVEKPYRKQGFGAELLQTLEERVALLGVVHFLVVTAGYEAPGFYQKQGYRIVFEQEDYYATGHSRVMLHKTQVPATLKEN